MGRWAVVALLVGVGLFLAAGDPLAAPPPAEAGRQVRAKIAWSFDPECPATLRDRALADPNGRDRSEYRFCRDAAISRQSNPNQANQIGLPGQGPVQGQVVPGTLFHDLATLTPTQDVASAVIRVDQGSYGPQRSVHVKIKLPGQPDNVAGTQIELPGSADAPALQAGMPFTIELLSQIPSESQDRPAGSSRPTRRLLTSTVRVAERAARSPALSNLNRPLIVRTELQLNVWAVKNDRPTPTPQASAPGR
ncbi:MAG TPA: hypothetical protein VGL23_17895 [Chloroflexota bacterium]